MNVTVLFHDVLAMQFAKEEYENVPDGSNVMDYDWFLVDSELYSRHVSNGGIGVSGFDTYIIGRLNET